MCCSTEMAWPRNRSTRCFANASRKVCWSLALSEPPTSMPLTCAPSLAPLGMISIVIETSPVALSFRLMRAAAFLPPFVGIALPQHDAPLKKRRTQPSRVQLRALYPAAHGNTG